MEEDNYVTWKWQIVNVFRAKNLFNAISSQDVEEANSRQALALLGSSLSRENMALVVGGETAFEAWRRLEIVFENKTTFEKQELLGKLHSYKMEKVTEVPNMLMDVQTTAQKLKLLGEPVSDDALISIIMNALPEGFSGLLMAFKLLNSTERTLNHLISQVIAHSKEISRESTAIALVANTSSGTVPRNNNICNFCKQPGHWIKDCSKVKNKRQYEERKHEKKGASIDEAKSTPAKNIVSFMALVSSCKLNQSQWVADSGSSNHMSPNIKWFLSFNRSEKDVNVRLGDGSCMPAHGYGQIHTDAGIIEDVYYIPNMVTNLFSIQAATRKNIIVKYSMNEVTFVKNNTVVLKANQFR